MRKESKSLLHFTEEVNVDVSCADVPEVPLGVVLEVVRDGDPDGALPLLTVVLQDDACVRG